MHTLAVDSVRIHNESLHMGFTQFWQYLVPAMVVFGYLWVKFVKH